MKREDEYILLAVVVLFAVIIGMGLYFNHRILSIK